MIKVALSNHHIHLNKESLNALFGENYELTVKRPLLQKGQFAAEETVTLVKNNKTLEHIRVVGPLRSYTQVELLDKDNEYFYTIVNNMKDNKVNLRLPKFEINYEKKLKEVLKTMGVNLPFEKNADFSKIRVQNDIYINEIIHKTYLKVNEQGTEAAAVTAIEMVFNSAANPRLEKIYNMHVNRPFIFILRNDRLPKNYDIIFISKIEKLN